MKKLLVAASALFVALSLSSVAYGGDHRERGATAAVVAVGSQVDDAGHN